MNDKITSHQNGFCKIGGLDFCVTVFRKFFQCIIGNLMLKIATFAKSKNGNIFAKMAFEKIFTGLTLLLAFVIRLIVRNMSHIYPN